MAYKVFLSAGHGGSDPGAIGNGLKEKNINLQIMLECRKTLVRHGLVVVCSRLKDEYDPVQQEVDEANASNADLAFSMHTNAGGGDGSESFYYAGNKDGERLAELVEKHMKAIGQNSRGIKTNNLMFTRETKMTAVLSECAFIDNKKDIAIVDTVAEQKKFGVAYAKAILEYFGIKYKEETTASKPAETKPSASTNNSFRVRIDVTQLNIRKGPGTNYAKIGKYTGKGVFTIVETANGKGASKWGLLKSYQSKRDGWISLDYAKRI